MEISHYEVALKILRLAFSPKCDHRGNKEGIVDIGGSSPGQIQTIPSCSKHGNDRMRTLSIFVAGIFSHFPSVEYSHPEGYDMVTGEGNWVPEVLQTGINHDGEEEVLSCPPIAVLGAELNHLKSPVNIQELAFCNGNSWPGVIDMEQDLPCVLLCIFSFIITKHCIHLDSSISMTNTLK
uniref:Uncharacterized protein n=1 Tax=Leersia perrieri TaxID=77586 RepID=A0A0D9XMN3_9ORYZ